MTDQYKPIDDKIKQRSLKQSELADLGEDIALSAKSTVVAFIDLADSTAMKQDRKPEDWLGSIYEFLIRCSEIVRASGGTVVKRIGDEIMATFTTVIEAESFIDAVINDKALNNYRYKIALDFGEAFHFRFIEGREDDPYGTVVDRCARIAKLSIAGTIICSGSYHEELANKQESSYIDVGKFPVKGLKDHCRIYLRSLNEIDSESYLAPLLASINSKRSNLDGFTQVGRKLSIREIRESLSGQARPYIARELLNLPRCPLSATAFFAERKKLTRKEDFDQSFLGYIVEWELYFSSYSRDYDDSISIYATATRSVQDIVVASLPTFALEVVKLLREGQLLKIRGSLQHMHSNTPFINYVELEAIST